MFWGKRETNMQLLEEVREGRIVGAYLTAELVSMTILSSEGVLDRGVSRFMKDILMDGVHSSN